MHLAMMDSILYRGDRGERSHTLWSKGLYPSR